MRVLTPQDRACFDDLCYVIVRQAVPPDMVQAVVDAMRAHPTSAAVQQRGSYALGILLDAEEKTSMLMRL